MNPRFVYLSQTETTVGFLSQDKTKLAKIKQRDINQPFIKCVDSLQTLNDFARVPKKYKKLVRRTKKTTFIYPNNKAIRVIKDKIHLSFLKKFKWFYSSSANETTKSFDEQFAKQKVDIIIEERFGFFESSPSNIIKLGKYSKRRLR